MCTKKWNFSVKAFKSSSTNEAHADRRMRPNALQRRNSVNFAGSDENFVWYSVLVCRNENHAGVWMFRSLERLQVWPRVGTQLHDACRRQMLPRVLSGQFWRICTTSYIHTSLFTQRVATTTQETKCFSKKHTANPRINSPGVYSYNRSEHRRLLETRRLLNLAV